MSIHTLLGIEKPIIQAPMAGVQNHELAVAVSNAGGLGSLPCAMLTATQLDQELAALTRLTDRPYNVNFFCHTSPSQDHSAEGRWRAALLPYYEEMGLDLSVIQSGPGRAPFHAELLEVLAAYRPPVVSFHFGLPEPAMLERIRAWGGKILSSATTVAEAKWLEAHGVDAIIAQGLEAGGHRGFFLNKDIATQMGTFALVPQVVKAVSVPVIAAGGIADANGVRAILSLGASAVQVGTAYLLCHEAKTSPLHRAALQSDRAVVTALTNLFTGGPARGIVNRVMRELGPICPDTPPFPLATAAIAPLRSQAESQDNADFSPLWAGQNTQGCDAISAAEMTRRLVSQC